jgi:hypothetical protein
VFRFPGGGSEVFDFTNIGKRLIVIGLLIAGIGVALLLSVKIPGSEGSPAISCSKESTPHSTFR